MNGGPRGDAGALSIPVHPVTPATPATTATTATTAMEPWNRVRVVFGKEGRLRFLGQLDLGRTLDRAVRLSGLEARFSEGFSPRIRFSFPCASPTGMGSRCEIVELQVARPAGAAEVLAALGGAMPPGLPLLAAEDVPEGERLRIEAASYRVRPREGDPVPAGGAVAALMARAEIPVERRGRTVDLRPLLEDLRSGGDALSMRIRFLETGATARPEDVLGALGADPGAFRLERTAMRVRLRLGGKETLREYGVEA